MDLYLNEPIEDVNINDLVYDSLGIKVSSYAESVLVLCFLAGSVSYEEIFSIFGRVPSMFRAKVIPNLVKNGLLKKEMFPKPDGSCISCFICTPKGASKARELCNLSQKGSAKIRSALNTHSYSTGYNLYQLITHRLSIRWFIEAPYDDPEKDYVRWMRGSLLRTDCTAVYDNGRVLRIEEDRCTENISVLYDKLVNYSSYGCFDDPSDVLVFSIREAGVSVPDYPGMDKKYIYSPAKCRELISAMKETGAEDASYLLGHKEIFSHQEYLSFMLKRLYKAYGQMSVDVPFLKEFLMPLNSGICPLQQEDFNEMHMRAAGNILRYLAQVLKDDHKVRTKLMEGRSVGLIPTSLMGRYLPYLMLGEHLSVREHLCHFLGKYFGKIEFEEEIADPLYVGEYRSPLMMRNSFISPDGITVCLEFPSIDVGSWVRCRDLSKAMDTLSASLQVVCLFLCEKDARDFFTYTGYDARSLTLDTTRPCVYGMYYKDMFCDGSLFTASGDGDDKNFVPILP